MLPFKTWSFKTGSCAGRITFNLYDCVYHVALDTNWIKDAGVMPGDGSDDPEWLCLMDLAGSVSQHLAKEYWVLVSEPGFCLGFGPFPWKSNSFTRNAAQEQHSLLDTIFDYIFYFGPPGKYL